MYWFLYDRDLGHERVKDNKYNQIIMITHLLNHLQTGD